MLSAARVVMASCEVPLAVTEQAFAMAREHGRAHDHGHGVTTLLNPAPAMPLPDSLWPLIDVLTPNEGELQQLAGEVDTALAAERLLARGVGALVVTLGAKGCCLYRTGHAPLAVAGHTVQVADTIGAGDTFTGALAAALARGEDWPAALACANAAAALSTRAHGAVSAMPSRETVRNWLAQLG
jgi:ribokinase